MDINLCKYYQKHFISLVYPAPLFQYQNHLIASLSHLFVSFTDVCLEMFVLRKKWR